MNDLTIVGTYGDGDKVITLKMQSGLVPGVREYPNARMAEAERLAQFLDENLPVVTLIAGCSGWARGSGDERRELPSALHHRGAAVVDVGRRLPVRHGRRDVAMSEIYVGAYWYGIPIDAETTACIVVACVAVLGLCGGSYARKAALHKARQRHKARKLAMLAAGARVGADVVASWGRPEPSALCPIGKSRAACCYRPSRCAQARQGGRNVLLLGEIQRDQARRLELARGAATTPPEGLPTLLLRRWQRRAGAEAHALGRRD